MFNQSDKIKDTIDDDVRPILDALNTREGWNTQAREHLAELKKLLKRKRYKTFMGHPTRYHLTSIGQSCLYDVPMYRKGALADFRGKRVRLVCISSGRFTRQLMAGVVGVTPTDKLLTKKKNVYVFPEIGDHDIAYLGRRYMLIKAAGKFEIILYQGSHESIGLNTCDFILLDGKNCCPIATLKINADAKLIGKLVGWLAGEIYDSIPEAVRGLAKKSAQQEIIPNLS